MPTDLREGWPGQTELRPIRRLGRLVTETCWRNTRRRATVIR